MKPLVAVVISIMFVGSSLVTPPIVRAAPTTWAEPASGPPGTSFTIRGTGFEAYEPLMIQLIDPAGQEYGFPGFINTTGRGAFVETTTLNYNVQAGAYTYTVRRPADPGIVVASTALMLTFPEVQCFSQTGKCMRGRFLAYWWRHGGLNFNGYPISDEFMERLEDGKNYTVQYFERVRMEFHPENADTEYEVLLGQFGRRIHPTDPPIPAQQNCVYIEQTRHNICSPFLAYWVGVVGEGGANFGFPISEAFLERLEDGNWYHVQYFERVRLEYHPENPAGYQFLLGQFGRRILAEAQR